MLKRFVTAISAAAVIAFASAAGMSVSATTVHDVAAVARQYGYSEDLIMQGYNKYYENPGLYTSDDFDQAIAWLHASGNVLVTTGEQVTVTTIPAQTAAAPSQTGTATTTAGDNASAEDPKAPVTITMPDGTTFTRISRSEFIKLSYEGKMDYIRTFTPAQQQAIIDNLSPDEYRSLLKQAPNGVKVEVVDKLTQAAGQLGMNVTVNEISDDKISLDLRDENGDKIGAANAGVIVENTGYDRSIVLKAALLLFAAAAAAVGYFAYRINKKVWEDK